MVIFTKKNEFSFDDLINTSIETGAFILVNKSLNWTSFDVVAKIRSLTKIKKIGHAGTLDPLAVGLLIVALGKKATKEIEMFRDLNKTYLAEIKLGATTITDDSEANEENIKDISEISELQIKNVIKKFIGNIEQIPPIFSAQKINGTPAYKSARKNKEILLRPKQVEIFSIEIKKVSLPLITIEVICSKGTYIRSLARDIGKELRCGAYLYNLKRTNIGDYSVNDALSIEEIVQKYEITKAIGIN